ncbi:MAG: tetratricopeptide repeat protein [Longimicrobiales bacterium]
MTIQQFVEELQRRHVFRVAGAYLVASWFMLEVTKTIAELLDWQQTIARFVLYVAIAGFPLMLVLSWMFDFTKDGIIRTPKWDSGKVPTDPTTNAGDAGALNLAMAGATATPAPKVVLSAKATGMFGLGALVAIVTLAAYTRTHMPVTFRGGVAGDSSALVSIKSIAVLPFEDLSQEHDQKYFADGMTEELLNRLAQLDSVQIVSGEGYVGPSGGGDLRSLANRLNVQAVLQGSVRRSQDSLRITVKLINTATNGVLYSEQFTRAVSNVFQVQDEIAESVASSLQLQLSSGLAQANGNRGTKNAKAYELYRKGDDALGARTEESLRRAIDFFQQAEKLDAGFALAYAGEAQVYAVLPTVSPYSLRDAGRKGNNAAAIAIGLDPTLGQAFAALGQIAQNLDWNPAGAENHYKAAIKHMSSYATAHQWYAETLAMLGRTDQAVEEINEAIKLAPASPASLNTLGYVLTIRGDLDSALAVFRSAAAAYPDYKLGHLTHSLTALTAKQYSEAETAALAYAGKDAKMATALTAVIRGAAGTASVAAGRAAAATLEPTLGPGFTALWFAALGDNATALRLVKKTWDAGNDANFPYFVIYPLLRPLHDSPVYKEIVSNMGVVPAR